MQYVVGLKAWTTISPSYVCRFQLLNKLLLACSPLPIVSLAYMPTPPPSPTWCPIAAAMLNSCARNSGRMHAKMNCRSAVAVHSLSCERYHSACHRSEGLGLMVQGQELEALRAATPYQHIVYCGDGANDLCPALALASTDTVLARKVVKVGKMRRGGRGKKTNMRNLPVVHVCCA